MSWIHAVFSAFFELLFGCRHEKLTRPFTLDHQTYKVCLECGKHVFYSPDTLTRLSAREQRRMRSVQISEFRVPEPQTVGPQLVRPVGGRSKGQGTTSAA